jgi:D-alanyl-D-alanine carboxypeptidase
MPRTAFTVLLLIIASACAQIAPHDAATADNQFVLNEMASRKIPGLAFAVLKDGAVIESHTYGLANVELNAPVTSKTVFAIGSITKSMTAIVVMKLVEDGRITLDDLVANYVADLPDAWAGVTVQHALSNTSGIPDFIDNPCKPPPPEYPYTDDAIAEAACLPLDFPPGERFAYSNTNYLVLSLLIEKVVGYWIEDAFRETIFDPLGMNETQMADYDGVIPNRADGYVAAGSAQRPYRNVPEMEPEIESGAGGVISTLDDMTLFVRGLGDPRILKPESWRTLWTPPPVRSGETPYALGFGVTPYEGKKRIGHNGAAPGFASSFAWFPEKNVAVIVLANSYEERHGRNLMGLANAIAARHFDFDVD